MKRFLLLVSCFLLISITACSDPDAKSATDLDEPARGENLKIDEEHYRVISPDDITIWVNIDDHPNVVRLCLDGVAFATISQQHQGGRSITRVEEWDISCPVRVGG